MDYNKDIKKKQKSQRQYYRKRNIQELTNNKEGGTDPQRHKICFIYLMKRCQSQRRWMEPGPPYTISGRPGKRKLWIPEYKVLQKE